MDEGTYSGSCHCGAVAYRFTTALDDPFRCNCSFCVRRSGIMQKVPREKFELQQGAEALIRYGRREFAKHAFCQHCGIGVFTEITRSDGASVAVNLACVEAVDLASLKPRIFDGAKLL